MHCSTPSFETISVIGLGYIGLPTAAAFAQAGCQVLGIDVNVTVVETVNRGDIHIVEPGLDKGVRHAVQSGSLRASIKPEPADAFLIAVPTPFIGAQHEPDLSYIEAAAHAIAPVLKRGDLVVLESTSPVGATEQMADWLARSRPDLSFPQQIGETSDIRIAHCPERVLPGRVMEELIKNDRIIGGMTSLCASAAQTLYQLFVKGDCIITDVRTAEMCKLTENAFRDINIAYANELSLICDINGVNVWELIRLANRHPRVNILQPGAGVGGHCIAVDPWFIVSGAPDLAHLVRTAREVNSAKPKWVFAAVRKAVEEFSLSHSGKMPTITVCGLAFKPDIDDLRESPALEIASKLYAEFGDYLTIVEPHITTPPSCLSGASLVDLSSALDKADIVLFLVRHTAFRPLVEHKMRLEQRIIDVVGLLDDHASVRGSQPFLNVVNC